jgi:hypothetical protein
MHAVLTGEDRRASTICDTRQALGESSTAYRARLAESMLASGAQIAWLCVLPGQHTAVMVDAALDAGLHVIVEKPWPCPEPVTRSLASRARAVQRFVAIHYEYCLLSEVQKWRATFFPGTGFAFGGRFFLSRRDHTGMPAIDNLGTHLLAIRAYAVPQSAVQQIRCGYEQPDERFVWLERRKARAASIDLLASKELIIQEFISQFEATMNGAQFALDLNFALEVAEEMDALR